MHILSKRNGIALMGVLTVLLVLTLLLPVMFTMSTSATRESISGLDSQRASYLARTMAEMAVAAYQEAYDASQDELKNNDANKPYTDNLNKFYNSESKKMTSDTLYMFRNTAVEWSETAADAIIYISEAAEDEETTEETTEGTTGETTEETKEEKYDTTTDYTVNGKTCRFIGSAFCEIVYESGVEYYKSYHNSEKVLVTEPLTKSEDGKTPEEQFEYYLENNTLNTSTSDLIPESQPHISRIEKRNLVFTATAKVNGRVEKRRCIVTLPTKPGEQNWIVPAEIESNQIFVDSSKATSIRKLGPGTGYVDREATSNQPVYVFSCIGNMLLSNQNLSFKVTNDIRSDYKGSETLGDYITHSDYIDKYNKGHFTTKPADPSVYSLGVHPITTTQPANDPEFKVVKTNNMSSWSSSATRDNFIAFTATGTIEVDMDINLLINPCRTARIGDGLSANKSLYKLMYFQAPDVVFRGSVNSFVSLYWNTGVIATISDYNAYRMSSVVLAAPASTPYSYKKGTKSVKAGKVYFLEDAYIWLVPFGEDGSNYKTQTVYYTGKDIVLYKFANAGDIYLYNNEVKTPEGKNAGFSITGYFMDVLYNNSGGATQQETSWWQIWSKIQSNLFGQAVENRTKTYAADDLMYVGNITSQGAGTIPTADDLYVVWES